MSFSNYAENVIYHQQHACIATTTKTNGNTVPPPVPELDSTRITKWVQMQLSGPNSEVVQRGAHLQTVLRCPSPITTPQEATKALTNRALYLGTSDKRLGTIFNQYTRIKRLHSNSKPKRKTKATTSDGGSGSGDGRSDSNFYRGDATGDDFDDTYTAPKPKRKASCVSYRLYITGLDDSTSWQDVKDFAFTGGRSVCYIDVYTRHNKKEGVIEYYRREDFEYALRYLDRARLNGCHIRVFDRQPGGDDGDTDHGGHGDKNRGDGGRDNRGGKYNRGSDNRDTRSRSRSSDRVGKDNRGGRDNRDNRGARSRSRSRDRVGRDDRGGRDNNYNDRGNGGRDQYYRDGRGNGGSGRYYREKYRGNRTRSLIRNDDKDNKNGSPRDRDRGHRSDRNRDRSDRDTDRDRGHRNYRDSDRGHRGDTGKRSCNNIYNNLDKAVIIRSKMMEMERIGKEKAEKEKIEKELENYRSTQRSSVQFRYKDPIKIARMNSALDDWKNVWM